MDAAGLFSKNNLSIHAALVLNRGSAMRNRSFVTLRGLSELLGVNERTVSKMRDDGALPRPVLVGRRYVYSISRLRELFPDLLPPDGSVAVRIGSPE